MPPLTLKALEAKHWKAIHHLDSLVCLAQKRIAKLEYKARLSWSKLWPLVSELDDRVLELEAPYTVTLPLAPAVKVRPLNEAPTDGTSFWIIQEGRYENNGYLLVPGKKPGWLPKEAVR